MKILNESDFNSSVSTSSYALVDFFATWCGPCKMLSPILEELSNEYKNINFYKVDVDKDRNLAMQYKINAMPTIVLFKDGKEVERHVGWKSKENLQVILNKIF